MDNNEATSTVMSRIQRLDPENACKIMGYILIQDPGEKEMIRLAFGPENQLISLINQAKSFLGLSSNSSSAPSTPSSPSPFNPISNPHRPNPFPLSSPRITVPNNGFHMNPSSPSSPWSVSGFSNASHMSSRPASSLSYAAVVNGTSNNNSCQSFSSPSNSSFSPFYGNPACNDEEYSNIPVEDELLFLDDTKDMNFMDPIMSPSGRSDSILLPYGNCNENRHHLLHRRSVSVSDVFLGGCQSDDNHGGGGWRPCMYFAKGFCKNGNGCKFVHGGFADSPDAVVGSPSLDGFDEFIRMKAIQQQRLAMAGGAPHPYNRCMNFLNENPRSAAATLMMGEEYHTFGRCRSDRNDFAAMGFGGNANSSSRQIYLTFPADSTFKEEDVSNYFSTFGPVQDVRIPYQQKRMFGFVTFVYPDTVKQILAKGNPHFVCDSRVLVKPYKEKGKIPDKKQQMERGDFPACLSPSGLDSREPYDIPFGGRAVYSSQDMILRRKLEEQAELQQAIEYQGRRLMNFQLPDLTNNHPNHQLQPHLLAAVPIALPAEAHTQINESLMHASDAINQQVLEGSNGGKDEAVSPTVAADLNALQDMNKSCNYNDGNGSNNKGDIPNLDDSVLHGSLEHILPDNLSASPSKFAADQQSILRSGSAELDDSIPVPTTSSSSNIVPVLPTTSALSMASLRS